MECTFLLGKTPASKRKKPHSEVEILEARLETIESKYTERLNQMENLLSKVMPGQSDPSQPEAGTSSSSSGPSKPSKIRLQPVDGITINSPMDADDGWTDMNSPQERQLRYDHWDQNITSPTMVWIFLFSFADPKKRTFSEESCGKLTLGLPWLSVFLIYCRPWTLPEHRP